MTNRVRRVVSGCWAPASDQLLSDYHDVEWGRPLADERSLFERMSLEGFQSGLSWRTVLAKRPAFREVFAGFDPEIVARFTAADVDRLMARRPDHPQPPEDRGGRHQRSAPGRRSRRATRAALVLRAGRRSRRRRRLADVPPTAPEAVALSKLLRKRGFAFVGPITVYAGMQACGLVDDHLADCPVRAAVEAERAAFSRPA